MNLTLKDSYQFVMTVINVECMVLAKKISVLIHKTQVELKHLKVYIFLMLRNFKNSLVNNDYVPVRKN